MIFNWMQFNKLSVNCNKSKYMLVGSKYILDRIDNNLPKLKNDQIPEWVNDYEYLGVTLDCSLTMNTAINMSFTKTAYKLHLLGILRRYLTRIAAINIFKAMVITYILIIPYIYLAH